MNTLSMTSCNGHISKNAEAHRSLWNSMMSWWSYQSKTSRWISLYLRSRNLSMNLNKRNLYPNNEYKCTIPSSVQFLKHLCQILTIIKAEAEALEYFYLSEDIWITQEPFGKHRQCTQSLPCAEIQLNYEE